MNFLSLIILITSLSYLIYLLLGGSDEELLKKRLKSLSQAENKTEKNNEKSPIKQVILDLFEPVISGLMKKQKNVKTMKQMLLEAGMSSGDEDVFKFMTKKILFAVSGLLIALFLLIAGKTDASLKFQILFIVPFACYKLPDFSIKTMIKKRNEEITYSLPDALDLLTVCVEAGLGLDAALTRVAQEYLKTSPILAKELGRVSKDILAGVPRQEAFRNFSARNNVDEVKSFAALLIQTDKLGTSISQSLRVYSDTVRTKRRQRVEKLSAQASVKMIIPLVLFILPAMFVVLLGPAAINLMNNFKNMK